MFARDPDELVLERLEPFVRGVHGLEVLLVDPAVRDRLRVRNSVAEIHRVLERAPSLVTECYLERLSEAITGCLVYFLDLVEYPEVLLALLDGPVRIEYFLDFPKAFQLLLRKEESYMIFYGGCWEIKLMIFGYGPFYCCQLLSLLRLLNIGCAKPL